MKITDRKTDGLYSEFAIEIPAATVDAQIERRLKEVGKKMKIDGFRPGKAPMALLHQKYGESVRAEVLEKVVEESTSKALKEKNIKPAMMPKVDITKFDNDNSIEFTVMVEKLPTIEPADFKKIKLEKPVTKLDDKEIDEALTRIAGNYKSSEPLKTQRAAKMGDIVRLNFDGSTNGKKLPGMKAKDFDLELGSNMFVDTFEEQLVGAKAGDKKTIKVKFPDDYRHPDLKGQNADFEVEVQDVREATLPALDDELAKKAGMKSFDELKAAIRSQLEKDLDNLSRTKVKRALLDALDKANKFDVPKSMVDAEYEQIWQYHLQDVKARGLDTKQAEDDKDSQKEFREIAERRVRLGLLLSEIGDRNKVSVTNQEIHQAIMREAYNYPGQEDQVIKFYQKNPQAVSSIRAPIFEEKVVDLILGQVQLDEKQVSKEDLMHDPDEEMENARIAKAEGKKAKKK
jgi:trigger factor